MPFDDFKDIMEHGEHIGVYYYDETYLDYSVYEKEVKQYAKLPFGIC